MTDRAPGPEQIRAAAARIAPYVHRTPVATCATIDRELDARVWFKCENLQKVGAFKARGAMNTVLQLDEREAARGVITHSSGNHGAALAWAAAMRGIPCTVVMPDDAPTIKVRAVEGYGAIIESCERDRRDEVCERLRVERALVFVHPFDDARIIAGQATAALELHDQVPGLELVIAPVGGGGLLAGTAAATRAVRPAAELLGAEPLAVDDAARSMQTGVRQPTVGGAVSVADGLMTGLGALNFEMLRALRVRVVTVDEPAIVAAARTIVERMKLVVEPSAATVLAALRCLGPAIRGRRIGAVLSGGNTDLGWLTAPTADR